MPSVPRFQAVLALVALSGLLASGCGGQGVTVNGRLLDHGQPYHVANDEKFQLSFVGGEAGQEVVGFAKVNPDGTFTITGRDHKGLPPGTYRVAVMSMPPPLGDTAKDKFKGKYSLARTPLQVEISRSTGEVTVDVGTATVTTP